MLIEGMKDLLDMNSDSIVKVCSESGRSSSRSSGSSRSSSCFEPDNFGGQRRGPSLRVARPGGAESDAADEQEDNGDGDDDDDDDDDDDEVEVDVVRPHERRAGSASSLGQPAADSLDETRRRFLRPRRVSLQQQRQNDTHQQQQQPGERAKPSLQGGHRPTSTTVSTTVEGRQPESDRPHGEQSPPGCNGEAQQRQQQQLGADGRPKRNPYCSRCRNHGKSARVKGHKRHCEYRDCQCEGCKLVECRQIVSAAQIKRRRDQKQDEECGRRIEVSPPVLTREPNSDPAALIAKTLIGSASARSHRAAQSSGGRPTVGPAVALAPAEAATATGAPPALSANLHQPHPYLSGHHATLLGLPPISAGGPFGGALPSPTLTSAGQAAFPMGPAIGCSQRRLTQQQHQQQHHHHNLHPNLLPTNSTSTSSAGGSLHALNLPMAGARQPLAGDTLRLFHQFPGSVLPSLSAQVVGPGGALAGGSLLSGATAASLSAALAGNGLFAAPSAPATTPPAPAAGATGAPGDSNLTLPSIREQFALVGEIHRTFGPLAIYAWLRAEHFNLAKVRHTIELAKISFDELLQINGYSPLDLTSRVGD